MDFGSDSRGSGCIIKMLPIIDLCDRRYPRLEAYSSIPGKGVVRVLDHLRLHEECPEASA